MGMRGHSALECCILVPWARPPARAEGAPPVEATTRIDERMLDELVRRIVAAVHPRRIVLFGSAARGQMSPHSDLDVLVVMPDGTHRRRTAMGLYEALYGLGCPTDIAVVTDDDIRRYGDDPSLVICPALEEGRELYRAS
jgi:predicted nucleotidyltransferase